MATKPCVLIMAGGTGGHVFPALSVAEALRQRGVELHWLGTAQGIEARLVPAADIPLHCLKMAGVRGKNPLFRLLALAKAGLAVLSSMLLLRRLKPFCVIGLGGYASGPGGLAAKLMGIPVLIHEQNAVAGTTNRLLAKLAKRCLTGYPIELGGDKSRYIGNPVRRDIAELPAPSSRFAERESGLRVLVVGGSLGALAINECMVKTWALLADLPQLQLWHQTGRAHEDTVRMAYAESGLSVRADAFIDDMAEAYAWADVVVCRAGALTVAELAAAGLSAILIPLPNAIDDHQRANAQWFVDGGAGEILDQRELTPERLADRLRELATQPELLRERAEAARALAKIDAADVAADCCMEYAHGH
ncbi:MULTISPECIES: undecaprenyldiphospho-muramoylpentapeptide beta-N-acetylglucosaminyltransferase [Spongiibacter]|uniref:undecaprenyldiphospho-muramoylpentapeptide beta-N-acetylglucosaminyltransferase n=2 Tax=Spongiibacteraceae TaxID=1706375 RepID=UPI000C62DC43|nr:MULTISPECIES: undecaprenyldiphospho-muramoylpentapeptide beta-N-acetylglucosaminyltransferase [Spongiibacter]MAY38444.1 undecaprenyldiphospho-muramoylpentapeptide beta-N-acetylglucosaminyltransferase [Spongiibacter sp.]MBI59130.1 undecaprenyldiphospho-muramoylpentapeptide beta-N-acetylglucosaminyltransferase [Spongiibacter sp.]|tara:strand:+ start:6370 stop:7455 length:1086 start_codon:yes stop_codon:yes gene_type:complete